MGHPGEGTSRRRPQHDDPAAHECINCGDWCTCQDPGACATCEDCKKRATQGPAEVYGGPWRDTR